LYNKSIQFGAWKSMDLPEPTPPSEEPIPSEQTFPDETVLPGDFTPMGDLGHLPRARRRRAQRMLVLPDADARATLLDTLARRAVPSFEFFLFAFFCGVILGAGFLLDSIRMNPIGLMLLGVLLAPALTPWVGMVLAAITGSWRFFFLTLSGFLVAGILIFLTGALAGFVARLWLPMPSVFQADVRSHLWIPDLFIVVVGAALLAVSFVHSEQKPVLSSALLAYGLFVPMSAAGFELGIQPAHTWSNGLLVLVIHLSLATLVGGIVLAVMHFKPAKPMGYILPVFVTLLSLTSIFIFSGLKTIIQNGITSIRHIEPTPTLMIYPTATHVSLPTPTRLLTVVPSSTTFPTATIEPTPAYAAITAASGGGAYLRSEPAGGVVLYSISNGLIVQVMPEIRNVGTVNWVHVRWNNTDGWVMQSLLKVTALTPSMVPSSSITSTP
jgi:hypothetical protein